MQHARVASLRSLCDRDQVGAVIVSKEQIIISTGRNGPPRGFEHGGETCSSWCDRAKSFAWVANTNIYTGPVPDLIYENDKVYASFPPTRTYRKELVTDADWERCGFVKVFTGTLDYSDCPSIHAEANALLTSDRSGRLGGTMYVTSHPCWSCAKMIANSGLTTIIVEGDQLSFVERRAESTYAFLESVGMTVVVLERKSEDSADPS